MRDVQTDVQDEQADQDAAIEETWRSLLDGVQGVIGEVDEPDTWGRAEARAVLATAIEVRRGELLELLDAVPAWRYRKAAHDRGMALSRAQVLGEELVPLRRERDALARRVQAWEDGEGVSREVSRLRSEMSRVVAMATSIEQARTILRQALGEDIPHEGARDAEERARRAEAERDRLREAAALHVAAWDEGESGSVVGGTLRDLRAALDGEDS